MVMARLHRASTRRAGRQRGVFPTVPLVLGVASTPHGATVELRDSDDGRVYGTGTAAIPPDAVSTVAQDPGAWWQALVDARHEAGGALGVSCVAVAATVPGLVLVDAQGKVLRPASLFGDAAARDDVDAVREMLSPADWCVATGSVPDAASAIAKLASLRRSDPEVYARIAGILSPPDWLTFRLGRRAATDRGAASTTGLWSAREERWRTDLLAMVDDRKDWGACLPRFGVAGEAAGDRDGVSIAQGTGDVMSAALGLALEPGDVVVQLGVNAVVAAARERPTEDPTGRVRGYAGTRQFLACVRSIEAETTIGSFARLLGIERTHFDRLASRAPAGAEGLVFVPPSPTSGTVGVLSGIRGDLHQERIARAVLDGVACAVLAALDVLRGADVPIGGRLSLVGGGTPSRAFAQVLADLGQRPVSVPTGDRMASGACVLAAAVVNGREPDAIAAEWGLGDARLVEPDLRVPAPELREAWRAASSNAGSDA